MGAGSQVASSLYEYDYAISVETTDEALEDLDVNTTSSEAAADILEARLQNAKQTTGGSLFEATLRDTLLQRVAQAEAQGETFAGFA
eukprot:4555733-Prorocentrum_lima.AAC.1